VGQSIAKQFNANNILFPRLIKLCYTPWERRYARNCVRLRAAILSIINKRRKGESKTYDDQADLLSILLSTDFYKNEDELMIDEVITFFLAGMKTIQISTTNLIYHLAKNPAIKARLLKEILPCVEKAMGNIVEDMTYESVMDFTYL
jgi:cytochrome P450